MQRPLRILLFCAVGGAILLTWWGARSRHAQPSATSIRQTVQAVVTNPVEYARVHLTGGIGAMLGSDPMTGLPRIEAVAVDSPAKRTGLRTGDIITKVDGLATTGRPVALVAESIRGFSAGKVALTVLRGGSTNIECVVQRASLNTLRRFHRYE